jgi:hypothetical protein
MTSLQISCSIGSLVLEYACGISKLPCRHRLAVIICVGSRDFVIMQVAAGAARQRCQRVRSLLSSDRQGSLERHRFRVRDVFPTKDQSGSFLDKLQEPCSRDMGVES